MAMTKQFVKTQWNNDREPAITAEQLNRMEKGIDANDTRIVELDKAVTKAIGELADKKITKFYASSQGESTLNDSDNGKMQDMMLYGKSEQKQYSGKNLLNATLQTTTKNGVTCTANGDGTYTLNGTVTQKTEFTVSIFNIDISKKYKLIGFNKSNKDNMCFVQLNQSPWTVYGTTSDKEVTISSSENIRFVIHLMGDRTLSDEIIKPMIVDASLYPDINYNDYEPYVGGIPSPNPDYPQEINSVVEPVVNVTNKDETESQSVTLTGITLNAIPVSSGGNVTIDGQQYISDYVDVERRKIVRMVDGSKLDTTQSIIDKTEWLLATPTEESLSEELAEKLKALQTYYSQTNLFITSNQLDCYAIFNYPISLANGWNYVKQQIGDTRDYIYDMDLQMAQAYVNSEYAVALTELEV